MTELTFMKELMSIRQANQKCLRYLPLLVLNKRFKFQPDVCNRYHELLVISMNLSNIAILKIRNADYHCIIS